MGQSTDAILAYGCNLGGDEEWLCEEDFPEERVDEDFPELVERKLKEAGIGGVGVTIHCSHDYPMYILSTREITAHRGHVMPVTTMLDTVESDLAADRERLAMALKTLGITPKQANPKWLLVSYWG